MSKLLKEQCLCCGKYSLKKKLSFDISDVYLCKNSCIFSKSKIDTNSLYTPEYFKNYYEERSSDQDKMLIKLIYFLKKYINNGSILDYGCGIGSFLINAEKHGFKDNVGIDISEYSTSLAQSRAENGNFYTDIGMLQLKKFDCISFIDSLAHIDDINNVFSKLIKNNLNKDGMVLIRTPNINSAYMLYVNLIGYFIPKRYFGSLLFIPNRLFLFNRKAIKLFLSKHDLKVQEFFIEPEFKKISSKLSNNNYIKSLIVDIVRIWIPFLINRKNSLTIIAKRKD